MDLILKRFCGSASKIVPKPVYKPEPPSTQFIISRNQRDAKLKVLKLCKDMLMNVIWCFGFKDLNLVALFFVWTVSGDSKRRVALYDKGEIENVEGYQGSSRDWHVDNKGIIFIY